jgi:hypothetical protein
MQRQIPLLEKEVHQAQNERGFQAGASRAFLIIYC